MTTFPCEDAGYWLFLMLIFRPSRWLGFNVSVGFTGSMRLGTA